MDWGVVVTNKWRSFVIACVRVRIGVRYSFFFLMEFGLKFENLGYFFLFLFFLSFKTWFVECWSGVWRFTNRSALGFSTVWSRTMVFLSWFEVDVEDFQRTLILPVAGYDVYSGTDLRAEIFQKFLPQQPWPSVRFTDRNSLIWPPGIDKMKKLNTF